MVNRANKATPWFIPIYCIALALVLSLASPAAAGTIDLKTQAADMYAFGAAADDLTGQTVVFGDLNGDGRSDMVIGTPGADYSGRSGCGVVYVVFSSDTIHSPVEFSADRNDVKRIYGPESNAQLGSRIACANIDGDPYDDIVCGVPSSSPSGKFSAGEVYVIYGGNVPPDTLDLLTAVSGVTRIQGENVFDKLGESVSAGDVNGDTFADIIAGAPFATADGRALAGTLYVVYGDADLGIQSTIDLATFPWAGIRIFGSLTNDTLGSACLAADVTDDGIADILAGAPQAKAYGRASAGVAYVISGGSSLPDTIDTQTATGPGFVTILGSAAGALAGSAFGATDSDGDQSTDLLIASPQLSPGGRAAAGAVHLLNGAVSWPDTVDLASPPAHTTRIDGPVANLKIGRSLASGDLNSDGAGDVVIGVPLMAAFDPMNPRTEAGVVYVVFGRAVFADVVDLAVEQTGITKILGAAPVEYTGNSVAVGRFDDDAFDDLLIGAPKTAYSGSFSVGKALVLLGSPNITPTTVISFDAFAQPGLIRLEWMLRDDLDPRVIDVYRSRGRDGTEGSLLSGNDVTRLGAGHYVYDDSDVRGGEVYTYAVASRDPESRVLFRATVTAAPLPAATLHPAVPNPFRAGTSIAFDIPEPGRVAVRVYDVRGALVASLAEGAYAAGATTISWDGRDRTGARTPSGVYFVRMEFQGRTLERKILLLR